MCLHSKMNKAPNPEGIGYKVFSINENFKLISPIFGTTEYDLSTWNKVNLEHPHTVNKKYPNIMYIAGFHIYKTLKAAKEIIKYCKDESSLKYVVHRVKYRKAYVQGYEKSWMTDKNTTVTVANEMIILERIK